LEQTRATLDFAARAANVVCAPQRTILALDSPPGGTAAAAALEAEVALLRAALASKAAECKALRARLDGGGSGGGCSSGATTTPPAGAGGASPRGAAAAPSPLARLSARLTFRRAAGTSSRVAGDLGPGPHAAAEGEGSGALSAAHCRPRAATAAAPPGSLLRRAMCLGAPALGSFSLAAASLQLTSGPGLLTDPLSSQEAPQALRKCSTIGGHEGCTAAAAAAVAAAAGDGSTGGPIEPVNDGAAITPQPLLQRRATDGERSSGGAGGWGRGPAVSGWGAGLVPDALRQRILQQLLLQLQCCRAESCQLRAQAVALSAQLAVAREEGAAAGRRLAEVTEGVRRLQVARQAEVAKWSDALKELDGSLVAAQQEGTAWREEVGLLQVALAEARATATAHAQQLRRVSAAVVASGEGVVLADATGDGKVRSDCPDG
jgi:hypothetical protein